MAQAALLGVPLAVVPLLPALRERGWLTLFWQLPFDDWQRSFSFKVGLSFVDRSGRWLSGLPPYVAGEEGGFYLGAMAALAAAWLARHRAEPAWRPPRVALALVLLCAWLSMGPRSAAGWLAEVLALGPSPLQAAALVAGAAGQAAALWLLWPARPWRALQRLLSLAVFFAVPGFRLFERLPFAREIRAPWSVWAVGGSVAAAALGGAALAAWLAGRPPSQQRAWGLAALVGVGLDLGPSLSRYRRAVLPPGTQASLQASADFLRRQPEAGSVHTVSARNFPMQLALSSGHALDDESFDHYFTLAWLARLRQETGRSAAQLQTGLSLLGVRWLWVDKPDPLTPREVQDGLRRSFPAVYEDPNALVLLNAQGLAPAFLAADAVALPEGAWQTLSATSLQLASRNVLTVESPEAPAPGPSLAARPGAPFVVAPSLHATSEEALEGEVVAPSPAWLTVTQAYHPDWTATVDGEPVPVRLAGGALLAVHVPAGTHQVRFAFEPPAWYSAVLELAALAWALALAAALALLVKRPAS